MIYLKRDASDADGQDIIDAYNFSELKDRKIHIKFDRYNDNCNDARLYVGNIPWAYTEADVKEILKDYNPISVKVTTNMVGKSRGYALVRFENPDTVFQVIKANENIVWHNRTILFKIDNKFADTDADGHTTQESSSHVK